MIKSNRLQGYWLDNSFSMLLCSTAVVMFRITRNISPLIFNDTFKLKDDSVYNLRQISEFSKSLVWFVFHGQENVSFLIKHKVYYAVSRLQMSNDKIKIKT